MKKAFVLYISIMFAALAIGCSSGSSSSSPASSGEEALDDVQVIEIQAFIETKQMIALDDAISKSIDDLPNVVASGNTEEIDSRFINLAVALQDVEDMKVPESCSVLHEKKTQTARCVIVALGKYSDVAEKGFANGAEEADEGANYLKLANQYQEEYNDELNRLVELM